MNKSRDNLKSAFSGESQANRRYVAFARKARTEGYTQIAKLFRAAAEAETVHALNHLNVMGDVGTTPENLQTAISGETFEYTKMYPEYLKAAKKEADRQTAWSFEVANKVEKIHAELFSKALNALKNKQPLEETDYYVCTVCGNTVEHAAPVKCQVCGAPQAKFLRIA